MHVESMPHTVHFSGQKSIFPSEPNGRNRLDFFLGNTSAKAFHLNVIEYTFTVSFTAPRFSWKNYVENLDLLNQIFAIAK